MPYARGQHPGASRGATINALTNFVVWFVGVIVFLLITSWLWLVPVLILIMVVRSFK